jgi:DNA-binding CsgD family transcriptional regulator
MEVFDGTTSAAGGPGSAPGDALAGPADAGAPCGARLLRLIAQGKRTEEALQIGVSTPVAVRWFRHAGGMPPLSLAEPIGRYLSFSDREEIALLKMKGQGVRAIARELKRDPGTISRELRRNAATRGGKPDYRAGVAQWKAQTAARVPSRRNWRASHGYRNTFRPG